MPDTSSTRRRFGTFTGVFTPCVLTILGVILFLRTGYVVGTAGLVQGLGIILLANVITLLTALSLSAIATNTEVQAGGDYFLVSRSLGPEFGGAIGIALYLALAVSVALYVVGFTEALLFSLPDLDWPAWQIALVTTVALFVVTLVGANWASRMQLTILVVLLLSIAVFFLGAMPKLSLGRIRDAVGASYAPGEDFWSVFAIYFPAVTGVTAGAAMSGELRDPGKSLPWGTLSAVVFTAFVYLATGFVLLGVASREALRSDTLVMVREAMVPSLVTAGICAATLSSALTSFVTAPRILQAVARDRLLPRSVEWFGRGSGRTAEPRFATVLTFGIALIGGLAGDLNMIAPVITMFFLITYGSLNTATFFESFSGNPSFRPRFERYHWGISATGAAAILAVMMLLSPLYAILAVIAVAGVYGGLTRRRLKVGWGDAWAGWLFSRARYYLLKLQHEKAHPKNWRPELLVLSPNPKATEDLIAVANWLESGRGLLQIAQLLPGPVSERSLESRRNHEQILVRLLEERRIPGFPLVVITPDFESSVISLLQTAGLGAFRPNTVLLGWPTRDEDRVPFVRVLRGIGTLGRNALALHTSGSIPIGEDRTIDVWWDGSKNGSFALLVAWLVQSNQEWSGTRIRVLRTIGKKDAREQAEEGLKELLARARVDAEPEVVVSRAPIEETIVAHSSSSALTILGFDVPEEGKEEDFYATVEPVVTNLPVTLLVCASDEDVLTLFA